MFTLTHRQFSGPVFGDIQADADDLAAVTAGVEDSGVAPRDQPLAAIAGLPGAIIRAEGRAGRHRFSKCLLRRGNVGLGHQHVPQAAAHDLVGRIPADRFTVTVEEGDPPRGVQAHDERARGLEHPVTAVAFCRQIRLVVLSLCFILQRVEREGEIACNLGKQRLLVLRRRHLNGRRDDQQPVLTAAILQPRRQAGPARLPLLCKGWPPLRDLLGQQTRFQSGATVCQLLPQPRPDDLPQHGVHPLARTIGALRVALGIHQHDRRQLVATGLDQAVASLFEQDVGVLFAGDQLVHVANGHEHRVQVRRPLRGESALGHVLHDRKAAGVTPRFVQERRGSHEVRDLPAGAGSEGQFVLALKAVPAPLQLFTQPDSVRVIAEINGLPAQHFLRSVLEGAAQGMIGVRHGALGRDDGDGVAGGLDECFKARLGAALFGDVAERLDHAAELAAPVVQR